MLSNDGTVMAGCESCCDFLATGVALAGVDGGIGEDVE